MTTQEYMKRIHIEILEIMDKIHEICENYHLLYFLTGGTLLGAVRHGGFIPWDDDFDIAMPREDYKKFIDLCGSALSQDYGIKHIQSHSDYSLLYAKVYKKKTLFSEKYGNGLETNNGIFVDVFPLDETSGINRGSILRKKVIKKINVMIDEVTSPGFLHGYKKYICHLFSRKFLIKTSLLLMCASNNRGKSSYTNFASQYPVERKTQLKTVYGNGTPIQFEDRMYMAPDDYITDLLSNFGPKYMELPPVEKRRTHYPLKVVFSDGSVFEPTSIKDNKVSVEESINW